MHITTKLISQMATYIEQHNTDITRERGSGVARLSLEGI